MSTYILQPVDLAEKVDKDEAGNPVVEDAPEFLISIGALSGGGEGVNFITCDPSGTGTQNAANLVAATAAAALLTPNGLPLSATNKAKVFIPAGFYDFADTPWPVANPYIDFIGLGMPVLRRTFFDAAGTLNTGLLVRSADHVSFDGIRLESNAQGSLEDDTAPATYFPTVSGANVRFKNCVFAATTTDGNESGVRLDWNYDETFEDCTIGVMAYFGGSPSNSSTPAPTLRRCSFAGVFCAFALNATFNGVIEDCIFENSVTLGASARVFYSRLNASGQTWPTPTSGGKVRLCLNGNFSEANLG